MNQIKFFVRQKISCILHHMNSTSPAVTVYFSQLSDNQRIALEHIRQIVKSVLPEWQEEIKTRVPAIRYKGKTVLGLGAAKKHLALYVMFGKALQVLHDELSGFDASNRVIRFLPENPLSPALIKKIVTIRLKEIEADNE